ncbi:MAG: GNAT family N-acetyltransferase [Thermomicrobiales bacterium]|jgi:RimJ/RimL family protein N-acetyltransferase
MTTSEEVRTKTNPELLTSDGQTYLVGEEIYLRPLVHADAEYASAWRDTDFPQAPERVRSWIDDDFKGGSNPYKATTHLIVRKRDDRPVGSVETAYQYFPTHWVMPFVDPLYGEQALRWKAEALTLVLPWVVDDQQRPKAIVTVPAHETIVIDALESIGARQTIRFREKLAMPGGGRGDELWYEYLDSQWIERLSDPAKVEIRRTGTGIARPVTAPVMPDGDPPVNAIRIGPRVYLRPPQKSDTEAVAHWSTREIDASWDNGRYPSGIENVQKWFNDFQKDIPPETVDFAVCLRETDEFIGLVGVMDVDYKHRFGESASMMLNPAYREAGYGTEAKHLLFDYMFNTLGFHSLQSWVMFENPRSAAALRKQGYRETGREHWVEFRDGNFVNFVAFDLLASDWRAMPRHDGDEYVGADTGSARPPKAANLKKGADHGTD